MAKITYSAQTRGVSMVACLAVVMLALVEAGPVVASPLTTFSTPDAAIAALVGAVRANDEAQFLALLGSDGTALLSSGDSVQDERNRRSFLAAYEDVHRLNIENDRTALLSIGKDGWIMPIPLRKAEDGWVFDPQEGAHEILVRRIGRNELSAIQVCLAIVDAQQDYVALHEQHPGVLEYASKFVSTPGQRDGLYWETGPDEPLSPLGPLIAAASVEGYADSGSAALAPYHGYFYRLLTKQGNEAAGGARDYLVKGHMIGGFAVIAYPSRYTVSGTMTFIVSQEGVVYEKDLGSETAAVAARISAFDPDPSWNPVASVLTRR